MPPETDIDPDSTILLRFRTEGIGEAEVNEAEYRAAKAAGRVDHLLDVQLGNLDETVTVIEPDGTQYDPYSTY